MKTRSSRAALSIPAMLKGRISQAPRHNCHGCHMSHRVQSLLKAAPLLPLLLLLLAPHHAAAYDTFQYPDTTFNHLAVDRETGILYLGAVNRLFQLSADLSVEVEDSTGPVDDSPDCLPFKDKNECPQAQETPNTNMILVVNRPGREVITCGQVFQGICEKRSLESVDKVLYRSEDPGETQFVAANDVLVTTVALVGKSSDGRDLLFVGHKKTTKLQSSVPPVTVRQLNTPTIFSNEGLGKLVVSDSSEYNNHYVGIFNHTGHIYFLFIRRGGKGQPNYNSYVARVCAHDVHLYSYVEVQVDCVSRVEEKTERRYNLAQAAHLEVRTGGAAELFVVFDAGVATMPVATGNTALCSYSLQDIDKRLESARELCYTKEGKGETGKEEAEIAYGVSPKCAELPLTSPNVYPCGGEHTPSPIASCTALEAKPLLEGVPSLSAVVAVERDGHTIVFLGDLEGKIHKVYVTPTAGNVYGAVTVDSGSPVNPDLILDSSKKHLYVMTASQVTKLPVAECTMFLDCDSCMRARDPFCGWCILQGSCTEKEQCQTAGAQDRWLWSYQREEQCLEVQEVYPANLSITEDTQTLLTLTVPRLPALDDGSEFKCSFDMKYEGPAEVLDTRISCKALPPTEIPPTPPGVDHVIMNLAVMFHDVVITSTDFAFYDCSAVMALAASSPCRSCVSSPWNCHWCVVQYSCSPVDSCPDDGPLIHSSNHVNEPLSGPEACPSMQRVQGSTLFPVGISRELDLTGHNLGLLQNHDMAYQCVLEVEGTELKLNAQVAKASEDDASYRIHCSTHEYRYTRPVTEYPVNIHLITENGNRIDNKDEVQIILYNCTVGHADCSRCKASDAKYGCAWCTDEEGGRCLYQESCLSVHDDVCPTPVIYSISPQTGVLEGGLKLTITGSNLGQRVDDVEVTVAGLPCIPEPDLYTISTRIVCVVSASEVSSGPVEVSIEGRPPGISGQDFTYQDPVLQNIHPQRGPVAGGTLLTISGTHLSTGSDITAFVGGLPCIMTTDVQEEHIVCRTSPSLVEEELPVSVFYGKAERKLIDTLFQYTKDPVIVYAAPSTSFHGGGRPIRVEGTNLDVVESPKIAVLPGTEENGTRRKRRRRGLASPSEQVPIPCSKNSSELLFCPTPEIPGGLQPLDVIFILDNVRVTFSNITGEPFGYQPDPTFKPLNKDDPSKPYILKPGNVLNIEGEGLDLGISKEEVVAMIGTGVCTLKTLTKTHLYCQPPLEAPLPLEEGALLPEFVVRMGNLNFKLGTVKYETDGQSSFPKEAQIGLVVGAAVVVFVVIIIIFMYRRKSKQAMRDYKKVLVQLENLEISVGDQCRKEFTDLMTGMMDLTSDLEGTGIPFLDYKTYIERIFFPGHTGSPLRRNLDVPEARRQTVEQGLNQLSNLLNNKLFLTKLICTLEDQQTFSQRDRCHVASLLTLALHGKLEYLTEIMTTLLATLAEQYVVKNPKLMLRRTETMVEKLLTNWMSICLYSYLRETAGEPLYLLFRAIKYQVDKGPVDAVTGKAKRTLNDSRLLREDIEYRAMPLTVLVKSGNASETQRVPARVLDADTITQVKEKVLDQVYKGMPFSQRPTVNSLDLEWRSGVAGHLTLSDEDLTSVTQNRWKRLNTLNHYKVPDEATVALIPRLHNNTLEGNNHSFTAGEKTPMLEDGDEGGLKMWHLVKSTEEPEPPKHRRSSSMRERERAKAIPEIYLTRLLSMKGTLQKFVDDTFQVILGVNRPVPIAVKYFFDFLDDLATKHGIEEQETVHIWKTHSLLLRFWVLILKNPQMIFDVQVSDNVDAILCVIAQTFIDSCTISEHKVGRDSPVNKLLYAREIPRYKQLVEKYYADIRQTVPAGYQEMNSSLTELSGNHVTELNCLVALQELYNYISKYYDQIITDLDEDPTAQKMQLAYRLQQIAALVENKVTDL